MPCHGYSPSFSEVFFHLRQALLFAHLFVIRVDLLRSYTH